MEILLFSIGFILSLVNTALFYKVVYRRKLHIPIRQQLFLLAGIYMVSLAGEILAWDSFLVSSLRLVAMYLTGSIFTEIKVTENFKYWTVNFFFALPIEAGIGSGLVLILPFLNQGDSIEIIFTTSFEIILFLCLSGLSVFQEPTPLVLSGKTTAILSVSFGIVSIFLAFMDVAINDFSQQKLQTAGALFIILATLGFLIATIILLYIFHQREHFQKQAALENEYNKQQREYFHILFEKEKETKKFRHDMINHMLCIQDIAKAGDTAGILNYLTDTLHVFHQISEKEYSVGNETINVLLNHYLIPIRKDCHIEIDGTFGGAAHISRMELCTIFSNILKNAVEAVSEIPPEAPLKKIISIHASHGEKFIKMTVQNTYAGNIKIQDDRIMTGKENKKNHGFGIENTRAAVKRCGGSFYYTTREGFFSVEILLPAKISL